MDVWYVEICLARKFYYFFKSLVDIFSKNLKPQVSQAQALMPKGGGGGGGVFFKKKKK